MTNAAAFPIELRSFADRERASFRSQDNSEGCLVRHDFERFARDYTPQLLAVARRYLSCEAEAADAVQDAFLSALGARNSFRGGSTVYTWLYRIVVNACLMKLRSRPRAKHLSLDDLLPKFDHDGSSVGCHNGFHGRVDQGLEAEELEDLVRTCIDQLPNDYQVVLRMRDIEQLDTEQTAKRLNLSTGAVKTRLHRARQALRVLLTPAIV